MAVESSDAANMRTLSRWTHLLRVPLTLECPVMQILGHDFEEPLFTGSGQIHIRSSTQMNFVMNAQSADHGEALKRLTLAEKNPYDHMAQVRLLATAYDGTSWNAGRTVVTLGETLGGIWRLSGPVDGITADVSGPFVAATSGIEVIYDGKLRLPLPLSMVTSVRRGDREVLRKVERGGATVSAAGTEINVFVDPQLDVTWAVAATSTAFHHPFAENWVSEPLCLLLGQLVFPRLVARNFGNRAAVSLRPAPPLVTDTLAASILQEDPLGAHGKFWEVYGQILTMITRARADNPEVNLEAHPLTRYYHEVIQATRGSNWAWCLALASAIEGVANLLVPEADRASDYPLADIESLRKHISAWSGDEDLRSRILGSLAYAGTKGTIQALKDFQTHGVTRKHLEAWKTVRNKVMHGELVVPWSEEKLELRMRLLAELLHRLSLVYIERSSA
jgi:hypothetical protein